MKTNLRFLAGVFVFACAFVPQAWSQATNGGDATYADSLPPTWICKTSSEKLANWITASAFPGDLDSYWPNGVIPYEFDQNVTSVNQSRMIAAMSIWQNAATVQFRVRDGEGAFVRIIDGTENSSPVGRRGGRQDLIITNWPVQDVLLHELGHTLGFYHTQSRTDRDAFVQINWALIPDSEEHNFQIEDNSLHYGPYDFGSIMHYDACAFSSCPNCSSRDANCRTISVLTPHSIQWQSRIGRLTGLSEMDRLTMSFLYPSGDWRFVDRSFTGAPNSGTFSNPFNTFAEGESAVPISGTVWVQPGNYFAIGTHPKPMTLQAPLGGVTLGN